MQNLLSSTVHATLRLITDLHCDFAAVWGSLFKYITEVISHSYKTQINVFISLYLTKMGKMRHNTTKFNMMVNTNSSYI